MIVVWRRLVCFYCVCFFYCACLVAMGQPTDAVCKGLLANMRQSHIPHLAIADLSGNEIKKHYCSASDQDISADAVFEAASLSKPVFAIAVLTLVQQGKLDLDRSLASYLSGPYQHQQNAVAEGATDIVRDPRLNQVTARMVLSHMSGLPNWSRRKALTFVADPGKKWGYSAEGYIYLQWVIETITGESLQTTVKRLVFDPLGMRHSSFVWRPAFSERVLTPHLSNGSGGELVPYTKALASSTLYTTLDDYARFAEALLLPKPRSPFALEETKQVEVRDDIDLAWGLGVAVEDTQERSYFHWGANPGFQSFFMVQPASRRGVLFLTDSDNGLVMVDLIVARYIPGTHPALRFPMLHPKD